jgi:hypothetical protein
MLIECPRCSRWIELQGWCRCGYRSASAPTLDGGPRPEAPKPAPKTVAADFALALADRVAAQSECLARAAGRTQPAPAITETDYCPLG